MNESFIRFHNSLTLALKCIRDDGTIAMSSHFFDSLFIFQGVRPK